MSTSSFGKLGEDYAVKLLKKQGYKVLERNYKTKFAEIDIVAIDGDTLVFVEVKTRRSIRRGLPEEAVDERKLRKIVQAAEYYLLVNVKKNLYKKRRIDVVAILVEGKTVVSSKIIKVIQV